MAVFQKAHRRHDRRAGDQAGAAGCFAFTCIWIRRHSLADAETAEGAPAARRAAARKAAAEAVKTEPKSAAALPSDPYLKAVVKLKPLLSKHRLAAQTLISKINSQDAFK